MHSQIRDFFQARKRKVSIHVAQGDNVRAISELNRYLKEFMNDGEAWMELCDLYILEQVGSDSHVLIIVEPVPVIKLKVRRVSWGITKNQLIEHILKSKQDYAKASFCCEELILQNPHNHLYYQK